MNLPTQVKTYQRGLVWFRRDLRVYDTTVLSEALRQCDLVHAIFVFDTDILNGLPSTDRRVAFIYQTVTQLNIQLQHITTNEHAGLIIRHGRPQYEIVDVARTLDSQIVFAAHDYEPSTQQRDTEVSLLLMSHGIRMTTVKDHVIFEKSEILTQQHKPYTVYTPYKNKWLATVTPHDVTSCNYTATDIKTQWGIVPVGLSKGVTLGELGFSNAVLPTALYRDTASTQFEAFCQRIDHYEDTRNFPALNGTSGLSMHLRFGTLSIRQLARTAIQRKHKGSQGASIWLNELIWREFYAQILYHYPHVVTQSFRPDYDKITWENDIQADAFFKAWCDGQTGYPLVDAAMAQLNTTGFMHNRLRMVVASFLVKDLGIDWRRGEAYFALQLNDYELASNNGGWQWVASSGCDAQPYFRVFNPTAQSEKFDADGTFIKKYLPQLNALKGSDIHAPWKASPETLKKANVHLGNNYPLPIVSHTMARMQTLDRYKVVTA